MINTETFFMRTSDRNNMSAVGLFDHALDLYEDTMSAIKTNPNLFSGPVQHLQQALNRMITASHPDAHEMMRSLTERMLSGVECYSEHSLLLVASRSLNNVFKEEIMSIPYMILSVIRGNDPNLDTVWFNRVNGNNGIAMFLRNYKTSDIKAIHDTPVNNLVPTTLPHDKLFSASESVIVELGNHPIDLTLTSKDIQTVSFSKKDDWLPNTNRRVDKHCVFSSYITIRPQLKQFRIPKTVKLTPATSELIEALQCVSSESVVSNHYTFKTPADLFTCNLDITSFDSGQTWTIANVKIVPPLR